jgi:putative ABC transport system permease protein
MLLVAIQMLMGERIKYLILISALTFSTLLMTQQAGVFWGVMRGTTAKMRNTQAPIWVVDPNVVQINAANTMKDTDLDRVRSVEGVKWAFPLYFSQLKAKLYNGDFITIELVGIDSATLFGLPSIKIGKLEDLWKADSVIVDEAVVRQFKESLKRSLQIGDVIDINDHEEKVVGIVEGEERIFGSPAIYTTYSRAIEIAPTVRKNLSYVLVLPAPELSIKKVAENIEKQTGLKAYTEEKFFWSTIKWYFINTGIPVSFGTTVLLGFIVGIAVAGQTFYSFIHENMGNFGALKAMGASQALLKQMIFVQAFIAGVIGYGIGLGLAALFGFSTMSSPRLPFAMPWQIPFIIFILIIVICLFAASLGIRKIGKIDPAEVFRG